MEKDEYKAQLDSACEKFRKLMAAQLDRVEDMKEQGDFVDYGKLDCIKTYQLRKNSSTDHVYMLKWV